METLVFQRALVDSMLKAREEYAGKMYYNMTCYDRIDIFHFGVKDADGKDAIVLVSIDRPYNHDEFVPKSCAC
jgi:hypothetical protein